MISQEPEARADGGAGKPPRLPPRPHATAEVPYDGGDEGKGLFSGWKGWQERVKADPQFAYKVLVEQVRGTSNCLLCHFCDCLYLRVPGPETY
jgi:hypothetical protein